ncbi:probable cytochrome b5 type B at C-terminar half [Coccomyxa sp. Obi]|nr:probable cytochrome b5 type B at C-terminar half [Coccomyxa sp. Obi]
MPSMKGIGPVSYSGAPAQEQHKAAGAPDLQLRVVNAEKLGLQTGSNAVLHPASCAQWHTMLQDGLQFLCLAQGSDCLLNIRLDTSVPEGCICLDSVQQHNFHLAAGEQYNFSLWKPPPDQPFELHDLEGEVRLFRSREATFSGTVEVDAHQLGKLLSKQLFRRAVAVNELVLVHMEGFALVIRISSVNTLDEAARDEALSYHCYRGLVTPDTIIYLTEGGIHGGNSHQTSGNNPQFFSGDSEAAIGGPPGSGRLVLRNIRPRPLQGRSHAIIDVSTRDGEVFPVKRKLLRPCIHLTHAVRSDIPSVTIVVDTLVFDRVLIFLEASAAGQPAPDFAVHLLGDLLQAGEILGLQSLQDYCRAKLGRLDSRIQMRSFEEVKAHNAAGQCWLILDGMVLDVTRWLPEHPGGSRIIPAQSLNLDCARFFEVYHASRESFLYLQEFYVGELDPRDLAAVPCKERPSPEFLTQLRSYTRFRPQPPDEESLIKAFKSF